MKYTPELGQACFGQPTEPHAVPEWVESMFVGIKRELERVYWNVKQDEWGGFEPFDFGKVHWRPYSWGDDDAGPNFWHSDFDVRLRWYKYPGRSMSCSHELPPEQWIAWHDAILRMLRLWELLETARRDRKHSPEGKA